MDGRIIICLVLIAAYEVSGVYFHESSRIEISPTFSKPGNQFGFSLGFQEDIPGNLIVGAPRHDFIGKVYKCPIIDPQETVVCELLDIDMERLANYSLEKSPNQKFYLSATIAATPEYFLTCSPLWTAMDFDSEADAYGTCFVYQNKDKNFTRFEGPFEIHQKRKTKKYKNIRGGVGWNTLYDKVNKAILIAKNSLNGDISCLPSEHPLTATTSLVQSISNALLHEVEAATNIGNGLAAGNFFSNSTYYAFSMTNTIMTGQIAFMKHNPSTHCKLQLIQNEKRKMFTIKSELIGSMFGAALHAEDLNGDGYSDLLVGAPGQQDDDVTFEQGAVYIYTGGDMNINDKSRRRVILATKNGGRFGSAITTMDMDGDGIPEIFVSSPYEDDSIGAVYILSGHEVRTNLLAHTTNQQILLNNLKFTQRLYAENLRNFGYSLKVLSDVDDNGCNELAVGAPGSGKVILYRCIPAVHVNISTQLLGATFVKEQAENFEVAVCVHIEYLHNSTNTTGSFTVDTDVEEDGAYIPNSTFVVDLSDKKTVKCANVTVMLSNKDPAEYSFTARANVDTLKKNILETKDFNEAWVTVSEFSKTVTSMGVSRHCEAEDCNPKLTASVHWTGSEVYVLGSSDNETVIINVKNEGHVSNDGCVDVRVVGAKVLRFGCPVEGDTYKCMLQKPLRRNTEQSLHIVLNMSNPESTEKMLNVEVNVYERCNEPNYTRHNLEIKYELTSDSISINGLHRDRNVTDKQIFDNKFGILNEGHEYEIVNNGSVMWSSVTAIIAIEKRPFISSYKSSFTNENCSMKNGTDEMIFECKFSLPPNSTRKGVAMMEILNSMIVENVVDGKLNTSSKIKLYLETSLEPISENATTVITYVKELSLINNKPVIVICSILLGLIVLAILILILYKANFFKRKQKKKLSELRESVRRKSLKKNNPDNEEENKDSENLADIEVIEHLTLEEGQTSTTDDGAVLIETEAQVHC